MPLAYWLPLASTNLLSSGAFISLLLIMQSVCPFLPQSSHFHSTLSVSHQLHVSVTEFQASFFRWYPLEAT